MYKQYCSLILACCLLLAAGFAHADDSPWKLVFETEMAQQGDTLLVVGSGGPTQMVAFGTEKNNQGSSEPKLVFTTNGATFGNVAPPPHPNMPWMPMNFFSGIAFPTDRIGYAASPLGSVFKSTDGGRNWDITALAADASTTTIFCLDELTCWATAGDSKIYRTADGGTVWNVATVPASTEYLLSVVFFVDASTGFAAGHEQVTQTDSEGNETVTGVRNGYVAKTTDGGANWTLVREGDDFVITEIFMFDANNGYMGGHEMDGRQNTHGHAYITSDGGASLNTIVGEGKIAATGVGDAPFFMVAGMSFADQNEGWIVVNYGDADNDLSSFPVYYHTTDGGNSFEIVMDEVGGQHNIFDVEHCGPNCAWAVGSGMRVFRLGDPVVPDGDVDDVDGDSDTTINPDGDVEEIPPGAPGTECYNPGDMTLPYCNEAMGATDCLFNDDMSYCSYPCNVGAQCGDPYHSCCKQVTVADQSQGYCFWDMSICNSSDPYEFSVAEGGKLGDDCLLPGQSGDLPACGESWGATICIGGPDGNFCSRPCNDGSECPNSNCCADLGAGSYCVYGGSLILQMCPELTPDGDDEAIEIEQTEDDTNGGNDGAGASDGGGCATGGMLSFILLTLGMVVIRRRR